MATWTAPTLTTPPPTELAEITSPASQDAPDLKSPLSTASAGKVQRIIAGREVIGRRISIWNIRPGKLEWVEGRIEEFDEGTGKHAVRFNVEDDAPTMVNLADYFFAWLTAPPPDAAPNPSFFGSPRGEAAVGRRVRVLWPMMKKYYQGVVKSYDPETEEHLIFYRDGEKKSHVLKHEAVVWLDDDAAVSRARDNSGADKSSTSIGKCRKAGPPQTHFCADQRSTADKDAAVLDGTAVTSPSAPDTLRTPPQVPVAACNGNGIVKEENHWVKEESRSGEQPADASTAAPARDKKHHPCSSSSTAETGNANAAAPWQDRKQQPFSDSSAELRENCNSMNQQQATADGHAANLPTGALADKASLNGKDALIKLQANRTAGRSPIGSRLIRKALAQNPLQRTVRRLPNPAPLGAHASTGVPTPSASSNVPGKDNGALQAGGVPSETSKAAKPHVKQAAAGADTAKAAERGRIGRPPASAEVGGRGAKHQAAAESSRGQKQLAAAEGGRGAKQQAHGTKRKSDSSVQTPAAPTGRRASQRRSDDGSDRQDRDGGNADPPRKKRRGPGGAGGSKGGDDASEDDPAVIIGTRVGIFWQEDNMYYKAKVIDYNDRTHRHLVHYEDGEKEWLALEEEQFKWYGPKGVSAGCKPAMRSIMAHLGAQGITVAEEGQQVPPNPTNGDQAPKDASAVGGRVQVLWSGDNQWHAGEVLAHDSKKGNRHLILFSDGEHEWLDLSMEQATWERTGRGGCFCAGICNTVPAGRAAVGWKVGVYWRDDMKFYDGKIVGYDSVTGRHQVIYEDGEIESISLHGEKVVWKLPSGFGDKPKSGNGKGGAKRESEDGPDKERTGGRKGWRKRLDEQQGSEEPEEPPPQKTLKLNGVSKPTPTPAAAAAAAAGGKTAAKGLRPPRCKHPEQSTSQVSDGTDPAAAAAGNGKPPPGAAASKAAGKAPASALPAHMRDTERPKSPRSPSRGTGSPNRNAGGSPGALGSPARALSSPARGTGSLAALAAASSSPVRTVSSPGRLAGTRKKAVGGMSSLAALAASPDAAVVPPSAVAAAPAGKMYALESTATRSSARRTASYSHRGLQDDDHRHAADPEGAHPRDLDSPRRPSALPETLALLEVPAPSRSSSSMPLEQQQPPSPEEQAPKLPLRMVLRAREPKPDPPPTAASTAVVATVASLISPRSVAAVAAATAAVEVLPPDSKVDGVRLKATVQRLEHRLVVLERMLRRLQKTESLLGWAIPAAAFEPPPPGVLSPRRQSSSLLARQGSMEQPPMLALPPPTLTLPHGPPPSSSAALPPLPPIRPMIDTTDAAHLHGSHMKRGGGGGRMGSGGRGARVTSPRPRPASNSAAGVFDTSGHKQMSLNGPAPSMGRRKVTRGGHVRHGLKTRPVGELQLRGQATSPSSGQKKQRLDTTALGLHSFINGNMQGTAGTLRTASASTYGNAPGPIPTAGATQGGAGASSAPELPHGLSPSDPSDLLMATMHPLEPGDHNTLDDLDPEFQGLADMLFSEGPEEMGEEGSEHDAPGGELPQAASATPPTDHGSPAVPQPAGCGPQHSAAELPHMVCSVPLQAPPSLPHGIQLPLQPLANQPMQEGTGVQIGSAAQLGMQPRMAPTVQQRPPLPPVAHPRPGLDLGTPSHPLHRTMHALHAQHAAHDRGSAATRDTIQQQQQQVVHAHRAAPPRQPASELPQRVQTHAAQPMGSETAQAHPQSHSGPVVQRPAGQPGVMAQVPAQPAMSGPAQRPLPHPTQPYAHGHHPNGQTAYPAASNPQHTAERPSHMPPAALPVHPAGLQGPAPQPRHIPPAPSPAPANYAAQLQAQLHPQQPPQPRPTAHTDVPPHLAHTASNATAQQERVLVHPGVPPHVAPTPQTAQQLPSRDAAAPADARGYAEATGPSVAQALPPPPPPRQADTAAPHSQGSAAVAVASAAATTAPMQDAGVRPPVPPTAAPAQDAGVRPPVPPTAAPVHDAGVRPPVPPTAAPVQDAAVRPPVPPTAAPVQDAAARPPVPPTTEPAEDAAMRPPVPPTAAPIQDTAVRAPVLNGKHGPAVEGQSRPDTAEQLHGSVQAACSEPVTEQLPVTNCVGV